MFPYGSTPFFREFTFSDRSFEVAALDGQFDDEKPVFSQVDGIESFVFFFLVFAGRVEFHVHLVSCPKRQFLAFDLHAGRSYAILQ